MEIIRRKPKSAVHSYVPELQEQLRNGEISRRDFLRMATLLGLSAGAAGALTACAPLTTPTPTASPPTATPRPRAVPGPTRGGRLRVATRVQRVDHPARLFTVEAANQVRQVMEYLTYTGPDNITVPHLLERWTASDDLKTWTLNVRKGIKFSNGQDLTADDVVFSFGQWLDKNVGSTMRDLLSYLQGPNSVEKVDSYTVRLHLKTPQVFVPDHLHHFPALVLPKDFEGDFAKQSIGTGPFKCDTYAPGEGAEFSRREDYWRNGKDGQPLPYLEKLVYTDLGRDSAAVIAALRSGQVDTIFAPSAEVWQDTKDVPGIKVHDVNTAQTFVIKMRADRTPWDDVKVRQALKMAIDRQKMLDLAWLGQGLLGSDVHASPAQPDAVALDVPRYDPGGAKQLLAEAGYADGLEVELSVREARAEQAMAQALKESAATAGFSINLKALPSSQYWDNWTEVPFGITLWLHRPLATMTMELAYMGDENGKPVPWNESHWVDPEFDKLLKQATETLDINKRRQIMAQVEKIQQERGSVGVAFFCKLWNIMNSRFKDVVTHPSGYDVLTETWYDANQ